ncbi:MAG TPA: nascent polypeptide-associated complex protein [archaeon]|jgi:nascent polypeptide-associated complex subunit alpha|nr:nascent polypeptide-associated complex protein [archaeon]HPC10031.1 nascent polypeptide-associated complex protein [archaeon]HRT02670.1 nascent polypeptide-associated complex protein [Candidatus Diapherotrites archaeon]
MVPGIGGIDPRRISAMMKQMGIENKELPAKKVIIELENKKIIIENPMVTEISMQGQKTYQIIGESKEETVNEISEEDITMVMEGAKIDKQKAKELLEKTNGDIAEAISLGLEK